MLFDERCKLAWCQEYDLRLHLAENHVFTDWGGRKVSEYWGNVFRCGKSEFTVNRGAVNQGSVYRGFTVPEGSQIRHF